MNTNWTGYKTLENLKSDLGPVSSCYYIIADKAPYRKPTSFSKFPIILSEIQRLFNLISSSV